MSILSIPVVTTGDFISYDKDHHLLVTEDSTLTANIGEYARIWDDAIDVGLKVRSHWTGREVIYANPNPVTKDGEVQYWELTPCDDRGGTIEDLPRFRVYND